MSEIAKCPICGNCIKVQRPDPSYYNLKTYHCCGHAVYADTQEKWNKYAAAMELVKRHKDLDNYKGVNPNIITDLVNAITVAEHNVLEVFK